MCIDPAKTYTATFDTTAGTVVEKLDTTTTPNTTNNFVVLARYHYYDNTTLFRTAQSIGIIQGGSPHTNSASDPGPGTNFRRGFRLRLAAAGTQRRDRRSLQVRSRRPDHGESGSAQRRIGTVLLRGR